MISGEGRKLRKFPTVNTKMQPYRSPIGDQLSLLTPLEEQESSEMGIDMSETPPSGSSGGTVSHRVRRRKSKEEHKTPAPVNTEKQLASNYYNEPKTTADYREDDSILKDSLRKEKVDFNIDHLLDPAASMGQHLSDLDNKTLEIKLVPTSSHIVA